MILELRSLCLCLLYHLSKQSSYLVSRERLFPICSITQIHTPSCQNHSKDINIKNNLFLLL